mmetsp:Transcript_81507/g.170467  ORF Transcript_81507/g.170467 Transcript_81507/m.170467 type:complete len:970 (-) Transcript_81507:267-3176(-)
MDGDSINREEGGEYLPAALGSMDSSSYEEEDKSNTSVSELDAPQKVTVSWAPKEFDSGLRLQDFSKQPAQLLDPLQVRFSQMKMRHLFGDGRRVSEAVQQIETVRTSASVKKETGADWKILAPFPMIEVIKWRCKLRDEATGKAKVDPATGEDLYDTEEHWFTLDNRRLYCLQEIAAQKWPARCVCEVVVIVSGPTKHMRELRKFRTLDQGQSIAIGSKNDQVNYVRWCWRHTAGLEDTDEEESEYLQLLAEGMQIERRPKVKVLQMLTEVEPDSDERIQHSKRLSYILRRGASSSGFDVDENGWARVEDIIAADAMQGMTMKKLLSLIEESNRQKFRYEIRNDPKRGKLIRATGKKGVVPGAPPGKNDLNSWSQAIRQVGPPLPSSVMPPPGWFPPRPMMGMYERAPPPLDLSTPPGLPTTPGANASTPPNMTKAVTPASRGPNASAIRAPVAPGAVKGEESGGQNGTKSNGKKAANQEGSAAQTKASAKKKATNNGSNTNTNNSNESAANDGSTENNAQPASSKKKDKEKEKSAVSETTASPIAGPPGINPAMPPPKEVKEPKEPKQPKQPKETKEAKQQPQAALPKQPSEKKAAAAAAAAAKQATSTSASASASTAEASAGGDVATKPLTAAEKKAAKASSKTIRAPPLMGQGYRMPGMFPFGPPGPLPAPPLPFYLLRGENTSAAEMAQFRRAWSSRIETLRAHDYHQQEYHASVAWMQQELMNVRARQHFEFMSALQQAEMAEQFEAMWNELADEEMGDGTNMEMPNWGNYDWTAQGAYGDYDKDYNYEGYDYDTELDTTTAHYGNSSSSIVDMADEPVSLEDQVRRRFEAAKARTVVEKELEQQRRAKEAVAAAASWGQQRRSASSSAYTAAAVAGMNGMDDASVEAKVAAALAAARQRSGHGATSGGAASAALGGRPPGNHSIAVAGNKKSGKTLASQSENLEARFAEVLQAAKARSSGFSA